MIGLLMILTGCGNNSGLTNTDTESSPANNSSADNFVSVTSEITELESGFSAVRYDGAHGFDLFPEQGGADSDQAVLQFLNNNIFQGNSGLQMGGDTFGCSEEMIEGLLSSLRSGDRGEGLSRLAQRRAELLDDIHKEQDCIAFPGGLIFDIREHQPFRNSF